MAHQDPEIRRAYHREYYHRRKRADPDYRKNEYERNKLCRIKRKAKDPETYEAKRLNTFLRHHYDITLQYFHTLLAGQDHVCAICLKRESIKGRLAVDHDHNRNKGHVRGLLCTSCNNGLGRFGDNPERLRRAAAYLEGYELAQTRLAMGPVWS